MTYIACVNPCAVRDAQYAKVRDPDPINNNEWRDAHMPLFINIYDMDMMTEQQAIQRAAEEAGTVPDNIIIYQV